MTEKLSGSPGIASALHNQSFPQNHVAKRLMDKKPNLFPIGARLAQERTRQKSNEGKAIQTVWIVFSSLGMLARN